MDTDLVVIGAGVVGLAVGAAAARAGQRTLVLERHSRVGQETSSRNSEVIHAGLYYPPGSLKARLCVEGRRRLYQRAREQRIPHRRLGKLVVATAPDQEPALEALLARGRENGAGSLELVDARKVSELEPRVRCLAALLSPESGIVDGHALLSSYQAELEAHDGTLVLETAVLDAAPIDDGWQLVTRTRDDPPFALDARRVVNAAGLVADRIAERFGLDPDVLGLRQRPCKGDYFAVAERLGALSQRLVYPVPGAHGLGIHVTLDLGGRYRLGPDVEWVDRPDYRVDPGKARSFAEAAASYLPEIRPGDLRPDFAGIRPKLGSPGEPARDFALVDGADHGAPGSFHLLGIESPGLTAAGAIAERVRHWSTGKA